MMRTIDGINGYEIRSYKTKDIDTFTYERIVEGIRDLYLWFAPGSTEEDIYHRLHRHPETRIDLLVDSLNDRRTIGFSAYQTEIFDGSRVMFRGGTVIGERSHGYYKKILEYGIGLDKPDFLVAMTQNPRVYEALSSFSATGLSYPSTTGKFPPKKVRDIAEHFGAEIGLDSRTLIIPGVYDSIRKDDSFKVGRDPAVKRMFTEGLREDDGFLVVVPL